MQEMEDVFGANGDITIDKVQELMFMDMVISEAFMLNNLIMSHECRCTPRITRFQKLALLCQKEGMSRFMFVASQETTITLSIMKNLTQRALILKIILTSLG